MRVEIRAVATKKAGSTKFPDSIAVICCVMLKMSLMDTTMHGDTDMKMVEITLSGAP
jgi:hypothetical protein